MSKNSFEKAKDFIIKAGFSHIKIEMEADMGREDDRDTECCECYGEGTIECCECEGSGFVNATRPNGTEVEVECDYCAGEGRIECEACEGSGEVAGSGDWNTDECQQYILDHVSDEARNALTYSKFYYDGSVDSEMTLTLPVKNADYLIEYLEAFKALGDEIGNGLETGGAGLHIAVIPECANGCYPAPGNSLNEVKWNNFEKQVTKLLPALFMLASPNSSSRQLNYRMPRISTKDKYSAIFAYERSSIEYRLFETCYDDPEMIKDYIEVIANTLKYFDDPSLSVKDIGKEFVIGETSDRKVSRFYRTADNLRIMRKQLGYIKPEGKSIKYLMKTREVPNITELKAELSARRKQLKLEWEMNQERIQLLMEQELGERQQEKLNGIKSWYNLNDEEARMELFGIRPQPKLQEYINNKILGLSEYYRAYTIAV